MKILNNIFFKFFAIIVVSFISVFIVQKLARTLFFEDMYLTEVHNRNIDSIIAVRDRIELGEDVYYVLYDLDLTDVQAYIVGNSYDNPLDGFFPDYDNLDDIIDVNYELQQDGDVFYQVIGNDPDFYGGLTNLSIYYTRLTNGDYLVFEQYVYGLIDANQAQQRLDLYITVGLLVVLIPIAYLYSKKQTKPLLVMNRQLKSISNLEFLPPLEITSKDEIGELANSINKVSEDLEKAISKLHDDIAFEQTRDKKRRELIAILSHELKTPITTMRAIIEGMSDNIGRYRDRDVYLKESLEYLHYMEKLSKDLIDAINIESRKTIYSSNNIIDILSESIKFTEKNLGDYQHTLINNLESHNVICNEDMIIRVLVNLINNGAKYSKLGSDIIISNTINDDCIKVYVLNTNAFIPEDELLHLFEPFYRVEKSRSKETGGSGLGLFIIKTILDSHNSIYSIRNTDDGVEFSFTLQLDTKMT